MALQVAQAHLHREAPVFALLAGRGEVANLLEPWRAGIHRAIGGGALFDLMQGGAGHLLDATPDRQASGVATAATPRIRCIAVDTGPSMLIRPDACVAWADDGRAPTASRTPCSAGSGQLPTPEAPLPTRPGTAIAISPASTA